MVQGRTRSGFNFSGRESNPHLLVFTRCSNAVELPSSITEAQRPIPKKNDGQEARWVVNQLPDCAGFEPACGAKPLLPITQTQRPVAPDGIEPTSPGLKPGVLSRLNYGTVRESAQTLSADRGCGFVAVPGRVRWASGVIERR